MNRLTLGPGVLGVCLLVAVAAAENAPPAAGGPALNSATVSLPLNELRGLLEKNDSDKAPVEYVLSQTKVGAKVEGKTASTITTMEVTLLADRWVLVPLGPIGGA